MLPDRDTRQSAVRVAVRDSDSIHESLVLAAATALAISGCRSGGVSFGTSDADLLARIYSSGRGRFEQQAISVTVERNGLLKLTTTGRLRLTEGEGSSTGVAVVARNRDPMTLVRPVATTSGNTLLDAEAIEVSMNGGICSGSLEGLDSHWLSYPATFLTSPPETTQIELEKNRG